MNWKIEILGENAHFFETIFWKILTKRFETDTDFWLASNSEINARLGPILGTLLWRFWASAI